MRIQSQDPAVYVAPTVSPSLSAAQPAPASPDHVSLGQPTYTPQRSRGSNQAPHFGATGRMFDGAAAHAYGLCSRVLPNDEVLPAALALAREIAANTAPLSVAYSKEILWRTWDSTAAQIEALESAAHRPVMRHPDAREGVMAFVERRAAQWQGSVAAEHHPLPTES